jgi:hypothetical protein
LNDTVSETNLEFSEGLKVNNWNLDVDGALDKRKGATKLNAVSVGAGLAGNLLFHFKPMLGTARFIAVFGNELREWNTTTSLWDLLLQAGDSTAVRLAVAFRNLCYIQNGVAGDVPLVYAPDAGAPTVFRPGSPKPATAVSLAEIAGDMGDGQIRVRVRYVSPIDDSFFGDPDTLLGTLITTSGGSNGIRVTIPVYPGGAPPDFRVAKRIVERTKIGGAIFYKAATVNDNTTTTVDLTEDDDTIDANEIMPDSGLREVMPTLFPFVKFKNRIFGADPTDLGLIRFSEVDEFGLLPEAFSDGDYTHRLDITDEFDRPVACAPMGEYLIWYCGRSIHLMTCDIDGNTTSRRMGGYNLGIPSARGVLEIPDGHLVLTYKGLYLNNRMHMAHVGERTEKTWKALPKNKMEDAFLLHRYDRRQVKVVVPGDTISSQENDMALVYHYRRASNNPEGFPTRHAWAIHRGFKAKSGIVTRDDTTKLDLEMSLDYEGFAYTEDVGDTDAHDAGGLIVPEYQTGWIDCGDPRVVKEFFDIWVIISEGSDKVRLDWESDLGRGPDGGVDLASTDVLPQWDVAKWDEDVFPLSPSVILHSKLGEDGKNLYGKYLRLTFTQPAAQQTEGLNIVGIIMSWRPDRDRQDGSN